MQKRHLLIFILLNLLLISCKSGLEGNLKENLPPTTSLTVNKINLPAGERLVSQVSISWWGDDPDGYVVGFEYFIGDAHTAVDNDWVFTQKTDSTFVLPITEGNTDADVTFNIRAVDNDGARDENPASLTFPIRNTHPEIQFNFNETPPDTTYGIASFGFTAKDADGAANLNRIEIALNDTTSQGSWKELSLDVNLITLHITENSGETNAEVLLGQSATTSDIVFTNVNLNDDNQLYVRSIDNAAAVSKVASYKWFVKEQKSRILFLNDYFGFSSQNVANSHLNLLSSIGLNQVDYMDISDGTVVGGTRVLLSSAFPDRSLAQPTINLMLAQWDYIYWISEDLDRNIGYALELTTQFFDQGGKMFINIPIEFLADRNPLYQFLPFQAVQSEPTQQYQNRDPTFQIQRCTEISATSDADYTPYIRLRRNIQPANPIVPFGQSISLFEADFRLLLRNPTEFGSYDGLSTIATMNPEQSILYFGIDFMDFTTIANNPCTDSDTGDQLPPSDIAGLLDFILIETLGFEP